MNYKYIMEIDWKHVATTDGYRSLKQAYIRDVDKASREKHPMREKAVFLKQFQWVINRAKHYAHHTGKHIEEILFEWESKRDYWWLNYYQNGRQPKFHSNSLEPMGRNGLRRYYKISYSWDKKRIKNKLDDFMLYTNKERESKKIKPRWSIKRKKRGY